MAAASEERKAWLAPTMFKPGVSGNPAGKKRGTFNMVRSVQIAAPKIIRRLVKIALYSDDESKVIAAARELLNRGYGTPAASLVISGDAENPLQMNHVNLSRDALLAIASGQTIEGDYVEVDDTDAGADEFGGDAADGCGGEPGADAAESDRAADADAGADGRGGGIA